MEHIQKTLKEKIMRRVYRVYLLRTVLAPLALKLLALAGILFVVSPFVSFSHVVANMPSAADMNALYEFFASAFLKTEAAVQYIAAATLILLYFAARDLVKKVAALRSFASVSR